MTHLENPNHFIQNLSQIKREITSKLPSRQARYCHSKQDIQQELRKQLKNNYKKYKKQTLIRERVNASIEHKNLVEQNRRNSLKQFIEQKIQHGQKVRENRRRKQMEKKKYDRFVKQSLIKDRKVQIWNEKLQKSLQVLRKIEKDEKSFDIPLKLRLIQSRYKNDKDNTSVHQLKLKHRKRSVSHNLLPRLQLQQNNLVNNIQNPESQAYVQNPNSILITQIKDVKRKLGTQQTQESNSSIVQGLRRRNTHSQGGRSSSLSTLMNKRNIKDQIKEKEEALNELIQKKRSDGYERWMEKNSLAYKVSKISHHQEIKNMIQTYLKGHIKKVDTED